MRLTFVLVATLAISSIAQAQDTWSTRSAMPRIRYDHAAAASAGKLYVMGGITIDAAGETSDHSMDIYDYLTDTWTNGTAITATTSVGWDLPAAVALNGAIYQIGGAAQGTLPTNDPLYGYNAFKFEIATNTWSPIARYPYYIPQATAAVVGNLIYAMGTIQYLTPFCEYNPGSNTWTERRDYPVYNNSQFAIAGCRGKVYSVGGTTGYAYEYDPATDVWATKSRMPIRNFYGAAAAAKGRIYHIGGINLGTGDTGIRGYVWEYNPGMDAWTQRATAPRSFALHAVAAMDLPGGGIAIEAAGGVEGDDWTPVASHVSYATVTLPGPENPVELSMKKADGSPLAAGEWISDGFVELCARVLDAGNLPVRLELEVVPSHLPFTGIPTSTGPYGPPGDKSIEINGLNEGHWKWQARGRNDNDETNTGGWIAFGTSDPDFCIDLTPPGAPVALSPAGEVFVSKARGQMVPFHWTPATDFSPLQLTYEVELANDPTFTAGVQGAIGTDTIEVFMKASDVVRYWRIRARDFGGHVGPWSAPQSYVVTFKDSIDHGAGDALQWCGASAPGRMGSSFFLLIAGVVLAMGMGRRDR